MKSKYRPALDELTNVIRELGSLGELWTHQWSEGNKKSLKKIALPFDQCVKEDLQSGAVRGSKKSRVYCGPFK